MCNNKINLWKTYLEIPYQDLSEEALHNLIVEFVTREGTDYGEKEASLELKANQIKKLLKTETVAIYFDDSTKTWDIVDKNHF